MKVKKKGTSGNAKNFITRTQAIKKLQLSLADFRRLCIFKGIYPREPRNKKKANKGSTAPVTFYYTKDIQYLMHEPILAKFREHKTFSKKLQRALGRGEVNDAQRLENNRPKYTLSHIIKERYPTFSDALRDLDDPLNMLFLFANMPATDKVSHRVTKDAEKLSNQWLAYVAKEKLIRKVFVSIKGVYYEANVRGQVVRWLVPFKFPMNIPSDIDFRIMLTFLEFYSTLLHFVLFRLYNESNLLYPPPIDIAKLKEIGGLSSYVLQSKDQGANALLPKSVDAKATSEEADQESVKLSTNEISKAMKADQEAENEEEVSEDEAGEEDDESKLDEFTSSNKTSGDLLSQPSHVTHPTSTLFSNFVFFVGREVSLDILELCILSCGGSVVSELALDALKINHPEEYEKLDLSKITHQIVDRPKLTSKVAGRTYVQPQWVFDSLNKGELLPVSKYAPGESLPPHLSPWGDVSGYDATADSTAQSNDQSNDQEVSEDEEEAEEEAEEDVEDEISDEEAKADLEAQKELELEVAGVKYSESGKDASTDSNKKAKGKKRSAEDEEKELKMIMMTNKQRKLYKKMQYGIEKKEARKDELSKKKRKLEKTKSDLKNLENKS
ncbi:Piso0_005848 [Millerozyma farinosa CBS 7064]|uniref:Pescadillo homolog n=1 Tax=Pichia sorbitophila (strain ATCC MYA-4447 / BCRC 22081 / CBS 7064 / NBRC 10061 / NRRL Y-12695) TaxID=559304 RepID=G8Y041_PICSO|nr:Piso0_005848 [Millerozyma farinosa CBS 7064]